MVLPRHINIRHHLSFDVQWRRPGFEDRQDHFKKRLCDNRLCITNDEYMEILRIARRMSSPLKIFQVEESVPVQSNKNGMLTTKRITRRRCVLSKKAVMDQNTFNRGGMQEVHCSLNDDNDEEDWGPVVPARGALTLQPLSEMSSRLGHLVQDLAEAHKGDKHGSARAEKEVTELVQKLIAKAAPNASKRVHGTNRTKPLATRPGFVGMRCKSFLKGNKCVRMKSSCEPLRPPVAKKMKHNGNCLL